MERLIQVARETGYLNGVQDLRPLEAYGYLPPDKVVALCTGSQGEARAALARIATDDHPEVTFNRGDRVIFSTRTIPGNEKAVGRVINGLIKQGVEVITDRTHLVHVSGHPRIAEVETIYSWVRPELAIPVHGEALHLSEHVRIARAAGTKSVISCGDGDVIRIAPKPADKVDEFRAGRWYKDGRLIIDGAAPTVAERRKLGFVGVVSAALAIDQTGALVGEPDIELIGIPEKTANGLFFRDIADEAITSSFDSLPRARRRDPDTVEEAVRRAIRSTIAEHWGKKPLCLVHILEV
jgi:ribonuclease J